VIAAIDTTFLTLLLNPGAAPPIHPETREPVAFCRERIEGFIDALSERGDTLVIPAPSLAEALCATDAMEAYLDALQRYRAVEIAPFDTRAAYELAVFFRAARASGDKRSGQPGPWQHVKMDRCIVSIAKARGCDWFYTDDSNQLTFARAMGFHTASSWDLPVPSALAQGDFGTEGGGSWGKRQTGPRRT
jgi:hypothetical protein